MLVASLEELRATYAKRRLVRRGVPIKTDTYLVADQLIWGATARILALLFERLSVDCGSIGPMSFEIRRRL